MKWNCSNLPSIIEQMRNYSVSIVPTNAKILRKKNILSLLPISGTLMIPAICVIPSGGIGMLHACICGPSVLGNSDHTEWKQHGLGWLWHTAVGCQTCAAGYASFQNGTSNQASSPKSEKNVSRPLCNYCLHHLSATFLNIVKLVVGSRMKMLQEMYVIWPEDKRALVEKWAKQQIAQNYFNCTMMPSSDSRLSKSMVLHHIFSTGRGGRFIFSLPLDRHTKRKFIMLYLPERHPWGHFVAFFQTWGHRGDPIVWDCVCQRKLVMCVCGACKPHYVWKCVCLNL